MATHLQLPSRKLGAKPDLQKAERNLREALGGKRKAQRYLRDFVERHGEDPRAWPPVEDAS